jgi:NADPH:quinone reductase-like Zn-dependent oxidoreductase
MVSATAERRTVGLSNQFGSPCLNLRSDQVLIHAYGSSLNPLEYKLALLNFFERTPPVILGFDLAGIVAAKGANVKTVSVGDEVMAMADSNKDGGWATGGEVVMPLPVTI